MTEIEKTLDKLGLTAYEIKVYTALLRHGTIGAVDLAKKSGVPFGRIYDVLYQLELKGFVKVVLGKPKTFAPIEPTKALEVALKKEQEEFLSLEKEVKEQTRELEKQYKEIIEEKKPGIWIVRGPENIRTVRLRQMSSAKKEILGIISPDITAVRAPDVERAVRERIKAGVKARWIENPIIPEVLEKVKVKIEGGAQIRTLPYKGFSLLIIDEELVQIELIDKLHGRMFVAVENSDLAKAMKEYFEYKWKQAKPVELKT